MPKELTNRDRASLGADAVTAYAVAGEYGDLVPAEILGDLLGDLRHWAKRHDVDFEQCNKNARTCFNHEVREEGGADFAAASAEEDKPFSVTMRELCAMLAGLRMLQEADPTIVGSMDHFDDYEPLDDDAIDELCERIGADIPVTDAEEPSDV